MRNGCRRHHFPKCKKRATRNGSLPLTMAAPGEQVRLVEIIGGHGFRHRLTELGLTPGVELRILQDEGGPLLLAVRDSRLAVGRGMAHKILVELEENTK